MEKDEKRLTEHFRMDEFIYSAMAVELGLNNALPSEVIPAIRNLTVRLLEPLRIYHRQPMYIMSGYRSEDQAILYRTKGFIHLSLKKHGVNRKQILFK